MLGLPNMCVPACSNSCLAGYSPAVDNLLQPRGLGSAHLLLNYGHATQASVVVDVVETYQPTWPRAGSATDASVWVAAAMLANFTVSALASPSDNLDLYGVPPTPAAVEGAGAVALVQAPQTPASGEITGAYFATNLTGLTSGTNYTVLLVVRDGTTLGGGVVALSGVLVPDTAPPSFTSAELVGATADPVSRTFSLAVNIGLDEPGTVAFAVYGDPGCMTGAQWVLWP